VTPVVLAALLGAASSAPANVSHKGWPRRTGVLMMNKRDQSRPLDARPGFDPFDHADPTYACLGVVGDGDHSCLNLPDTPAPGDSSGSDSSSGDPGSTDSGSGDRGSVAGPILTGGGWTCFNAPDGTDLPGALPSPSLGADAVCVPAGTPGAPTAPSGAITPGSSGGSATSTPTPRVTLASDGHNELLGGHGSDTIHAGPHGDVIWADYKPCCQPTKQVDRLFGGPGNDFIYAGHGRDSIWSGGGRDVVHAHFGHGAIHCQSGQVTVFMTRQTRHRWHLFGPCRVSYSHTLN